MNMNPASHQRRMKQASHDSVAEFFRVLAEPARLKLVRAMTMRCEAVSTLVAETGLAQPLVSHHLRVLKEAGIVRAERRGSFIFYCLADEAVWKTLQQCSTLASRLALDRS